MEQSLGFVAQGEISRVYRLQKSLYGLKHSAWFGKLSEVVEKLSCRRTNLITLSFTKIHKQVSSYYLCMLMLLSSL